MEKTGKKTQSKQKKQNQEAKKQERGQGQAGPPEY